MRFRRPVVLPDVPVELLDGPFDAVALARARGLGLDVVELVKMRGNRRLLRAGLPLPGSSSPLHRRQPVAHRVHETPPPDLVRT